MVIFRNLQTAHDITLDFQLKLLSLIFLSKLMCMCEIDFGPEDLKKIISGSVSLKTNERSKHFLFHAFIISSIAGEENQLYG